jgi:hypothetical protein
MEMKLVEVAPGVRIRIRPEDLTPQHKAITPANKQASETATKPRTKKSTPVEEKEAPAETNTDVESE